MRDIIGHGGGGDSHTHYEAKDSLHNTSYARVLDLVSEGEILGLANGLASVYLNQTPVENADGTKNFSNVTVDFRTGTQSQDYIPGFPDVENEISVGVELKSGTPWVHAINNTTLSAIRITLGVPMLTKQDTDNGDVLGYKIDYQIELWTDGGAYSQVLISSFSGKTTSEYRRSARIDLPAATTGWQVRVTRLTANANTASIADTTNIVSYTEVIDAKLRYPMSAIVGVQVDASQFQNVPTRAYDLYGRIIQVPSNYDAVTRTYAGAWDGTFKPSWSSNPAWVFRDLALNDRYGLGHRISASQLDKWTLYQIARYCDEMVPNGKGGTEPRFTCNLYLQSRKQAYAVLQDIASIFRGISYWGAGSIFASADMPADPVYVYTAANVIDGKFTRTGSRKSTRYTVALVTWNDPDDFYKQKVEYVEDREGIARYGGIQQVELTAFGCTSQGQAQRAGRWALATSRLETEGISFDVGMDGAIARPGQIVRVADPARMGRRVGGRVRTASGRTVTLDKAPTVNAGDRLTVVLPTGTSETHTVASVAGDAVTVDSDWSTVPVAQSVWSVDSDELSAPLFRVLSVVEKDEATFTITAVQHEPGKFDFVENGTAITPRTQTALDVTRQAAPALVALTGYTITQDSIQKLAIQVGCAPVPGAVGYEGAYCRGNDNWIEIPRQASPTLNVRDVPAGSYVAKMWAVNSIGVRSVETLSSAVDVAPDAPSPLLAAVAAAQASADSAVAAISSITSDNILSAGEKPNVMQMWSTISDEHQGIDLQADALGISRAGYDAAFTALYNFIIAISPAYNDLSQDSNVSGMTMRSRFGDYYLARQTLLNNMVAKNKAIADAAATTSTWAGTTGAGKPADNATVGADATNLNVTIGGDNLTKNSSFEVMTNGTLADGWSLYNNLAASEPAAAFKAPGRTGGNAQGISWTGAHTASKGISGPINSTPWQAGKTYTISFWAMSTSVPTPATLFVTWNTAPAVQTTVLNPSLSGIWQRYVFRITWGAALEGSYGGGGGYVSVAFGAGAGNVIFDDFMVCEGDVAPAYYPSAAEAKAAADAANLAISNISSDNVLSRDEKSELVLRWTAANSEYASLITQANSLSVVSTNYDTARQNLSTYLGGLSPAWNDTTKDTSIDRTAFNNAWNAYYDEKQKLINALAAKAATMASGVTLSSTGALSGGGTSGQVQTLPVMDGARAVNYAPRDYGVVHVKEFKQCSSIGIVTGATYCTLETMKPWNDNSGGQATQWAYVSSGEVWKRSAGCGDASWGAWVRDLDRNLYTGDLNATNGAPAGTNVGSTPASTVEANAAAGATAATQVSTTKSVSGLNNVTGMNNQLNNTTITVANFTASASGMTAPINYTWTVEKDAGTLYLNTYTGAAVSVKASGNNNRATGTVVCTATDSKGFTATATAYIDVGFGTGVAA